MNIRIESSSLTTGNITGIGYYTKLLAEALSTKKDVSVNLFSFNFLGRQPRQFISGRSRTETNYAFPLRVYAKLQSYKLAPAFDLALSPVDLTIFPNFANWPTVKSRVTATTIHDLTYLHFPELVETKNLAHLKRVVKRSIKDSDFIITVSETIKKEILDHFDISSSRIVVTPIPPSSDFYVKNNNEIHEKYKIKTKKYIFFIGTIEPRKEIPTLMKAYSQLPKGMTDEYSLVISGGMGWKSEQSQAAITKAQKAGLHVVYTGYIDQKDRTALYQKSSLFVMPSAYEGFGMPILEAAASGVPVIASDIPVLRESAGNGALYVKVGDAGELSETIQKVLSTPLLQKELVAKASRHLKTYSWDKNVDLIINKAKELERLKKA